jgi:hypothetical protein
MGSDRVTTALGALERARAYVGRLDWSRGTAELDQAQAAVKHELETAMRELEKLADDVQQPLPGLVRNDHRATARRAAAGCTITGSNQRGRLLRHLFERGEAGSTDQYMQDHLELGASSERPRRVELVRMGLVADSGRTRTLANGREATVWVLTERGRAVAARLGVQVALALG